MKRSAALPPNLKSFIDCKDEVLIIFLDRVSPNYKEFDEVLFDKIFTDLEKYYHLYNFKFEGNEIKIDSGLSIKRKLFFS